MPRYSYACQNCKKRFRILLSYEQYDRGEVQCPYCQSTHLSQLINRVRFVRPAGSDIEDLGGMDDLDGLENDPKALGKMMRKMSKEVGEDMPPEFDEVVSRLEKGQSPEDIEADMPELADSLGGPDMGGGYDGGMEDF